MIHRAKPQRRPEPIRNQADRANVSEARRLAITAYSKPSNPGCESVSVTVRLSGEGYLTRRISVKINMQSKQVEQALNKQINEELYSAYVYLAMAAEADKLGLPGFSNWFKMQYNEELGHADRFFNYVLERDGEIKLEAIAQPEINNETALSLFEKALAHEQHISQLIFQLKDLARAESDHATDVFLEWFVKEQVEEEASTRAVVDQLKMVDGNPNGLFMIDRELADRQADPVE